MVCALTPTSRATSSAFRPASICLTAAIICASVCLLLDILPHLPEYENRTRFCAEIGDQVTSAPFVPVLNASGQVIGDAGGDYNADGYDYDLPNTPAFGNHLS